VESATVNTSSIVDQLQREFPHGVTAVQSTRDQIPTLWISPDMLLDVLRYLKQRVDQQPGHSHQGPAFRASSADRFDHFALAGCELV
jgi:hypothetical protein